MSYFIKIFIISTYLILSEEQNQFHFIGEAPAAKNQWPFMVAIEFGDIHVCSGTLINRSVVMTAAHCIDTRIPKNEQFKNYTLYCRIGGFYNKAEDNVICVNSITIHPKYNLTSGIGDLALLHLENPVKADVRVARLPSKQLVYGSSCQFAGWRAISYNFNISEISQIIPIPKRVLYTMDQVLTDLGECETMMRKLTYELYNRTIPSYINLIGPTHICTKSISSQTPTFGDSGGPLICDGEQHGIQSFKLHPQNSSESKSYLSVSTRLDQYIPWIRATISKSAQVVIPQIDTEEDVNKSSIYRSADVSNSTGSSTHAYKMIMCTSLYVGSYILL